MAGIEVKGFTAPEEKRPFIDKGEGLVVTLAGRTVIKATFEPGWHWKEHVGPIAETPTCQSEHLLYVLSGRMAIRMDDGTEAEVSPDAAVRVDPGHDAWVVGDVPCVVVDFGIAPTYAKHRD
jgi:mannose-6-phosphate isomerase-like protein (cupin superfamily)